MRKLVKAGLLVTLALLGLLVALGRMGAADPAVALRRTLQRAGYERVTVDSARAPADASQLVIRYDPRGQPQAAVELLSRRAAEIAWTRGRIQTATVSVRPRGGAALERTSAQLATLGSPPARRQGHAEISSRAGRVVALAAVTVLLTGLLVVMASLAAVLVFRRRRRSLPPAVS